LETFHSGLGFDKGWLFPKTGVWGFQVHGRPKLFTSGPDSVPTLVTLDLVLIPPFATLFWGYLGALVYCSHPEIGREPACGINPGMSLKAQNKARYFLTHVLTFNPGPNYQGAFPNGVFSPKVLLKKPPKTFLATFSGGFQGHVFLRPRVYGSN